MTYAKFLLFTLEIKVGDEDWNTKSVHEMSTKM